MIPKAHINAWRKVAPWAESAQVEQDLVLSRALVEMYQNPEISGHAIFRGGTALHKLIFPTPGRYSEDIDLVQREAKPIGSLISAIRDVLDPWLGQPKWKAGHGRFTLYYRFESAFAPVTRMRVKIEINTREHFSVYEVARRPFAVESKWFFGEANITTYSVSELLATKLRALYQRKKGRDLFDLSLGLDHPDLVTDELLTAFEKYMAFGGTAVTRAQFEANMAAKMTDATFANDVPALLRPELDYNSIEAWRRVHTELVVKLTGEPWKGDRT